MKVVKELLVLIVAGCDGDTVRTTTSHHEYDGGDHPIVGEIERISRQSDGGSFDNLADAAEEYANRLMWFPREGVTLTGYGVFDVTPNGSAAYPDSLSPGVRQKVESIVSKQAERLPTATFKVIGIRVNVY